MKEKRLEWVDVLKALGIIAIYAGHFGLSSGKLFYFVFSYHVALFFFAAGFFAKHREGETLFEFVKSKFLRLMVPYFGFVIINILFYVLIYDSTDVLPLLKDCFFGVRNQLFAGSLWFIPCIFVTSVVYNIILRTVKSKNYALLVSFGVFLISTIGLNVVLEPKGWFWSFDSAIYYLLFFALGSALFPLIKKIDFQRFDFKKKILFFFLVLLVIFHSAFVYIFGSDYILHIIPFNSYPLSVILVDVFGTIGLLFANIFLAILLRKSMFLQNVGKNTLVLCGTEYATRNFLFNLMGWLSLGINITMPLATLFFAIIFIVFNIHTFSKFLSTYFPIFTGRVKTLL